MLAAAENSVSCFQDICESKFEKNLVLDLNLVIESLRIDNYLSLVLLFFFFLCIRCETQNVKLFRKLSHETLLKKKKKKKKFERISRSRKIKLKKGKKQVFVYGYFRKAY